MALQVWLPLNGDLHNQGLDGSVTMTNSGATVDSAGKIGSCYVLGDGKYISGNLTMNSPEWSIACWVYSTGNSYNGTAYLVCLHSSNSSSDFYGGIQLNYSNQFIIRVKNSAYTFTTISLNTWHHLIVTFKDNVARGYVDGVLVNTLSTTTPQASSTKLMIGRRYNSDSFYTDAKINDVRIYDHCLSPKEAKEISKGLVLHYKLDGSESNGIGNTNLIANGWGGVENWSNSTSGVSTDVPEGVTGVTNSYGNGNITKEFIQLIQNHSYTISAYVKRNSSSASYCYLSLVPYDIDKLQISSNMQPGGFRVASQTTLAQDLNPGDTVIHLDDTSGWTTSLTYGNYIAIFGYKDSIGYTYPDMIYTRRVYAWGTTTDKSHLDKTNNTVTLNKAYTGEKIPAGTTVCQSSVGNGYYYPAYISASSAVDWHQLTMEFTPDSVDYLKAAKYVRFYSMGTNQWAAAITLIDNDAESVIEDTSGYGNNGTIMGQLSMSVDTPRYSKSIEFIKGNNHIISPAIDKTSWKDSYSVCWWSKTSNMVNNMAWGSKFYGGGNFLNLYPTTSAGFCWNTGDGASNPVQNNGVNISVAPYNDNEWHHYVMTGDGADGKLYIDGEYKGKAKYYKPFNTSIIYLSGWTNDKSYSWDGELSDFRIYSTALSADDILELYNTAAVIDDGGSVYGYEFDEDSSSEIDKTGILKFNIDERGRDANTSIYSQVQTNLLQNTIIDNFRYERISGAGTEGGIRFTPTIQLETNKNYTLSAMIRGSANLNLYTINTGGNMAFTYVNKADMSTQEFKLFSVTFKVTGNRTINEVYICTRYGEANTAVGDWFELQANSVKLEEGDMCTPWTPATNDSIYRNYDKLLSTSQLIEF